jgi:Protein of unknown function (DUF2585)
MRWRNVALLAAALLTLQALVLLSFGQPFLCTCGTVKLWEGVVSSAGNSQHLTDWYSFSHIIHGIIFYAILHLLAPRLPVQVRLLIALALEGAWEVLENTPWMIERYRQQALAQGYSGDSVINSISDALMQVFGFGLAWRLPVWTVVSLAVALELFAGYAIRDNLTLNVLNLLYPFEFVRKWQAG